MVAIAFVCHPADREGEAGAVFRRLAQEFHPAPVVEFQFDAPLAADAVLVVAVGRTVALDAGREPGEAVSAAISAATRQATPVVLVLCGGVQVADAPAIVRAADAVVRLGPPGAADSDAAWTALVRAIRRPRPSARMPADFAPGGLTLAELDALRASASIHNADTSLAESPPAPGVASPSPLEFPQLHRRAPARASANWTNRLLAYGAVTALVGFLGTSSLYYLQLNVGHDRTMADPPPPPPAPTPPPTPQQMPAQPPAPPRTVSVGGPGTPPPARPRPLEVSNWQCADLREGTCWRYTHDGGVVTAVRGATALAIPAPSLPARVEMRARITEVPRAADQRGQAYGGLVFWANGANLDQGYAVALFGNTFRVLKFESGVARQLRVDFNEAIRTSGAPNDVVLTLEGERARLTINEEVVSEFALAAPAQATLSYGWYAAGAADGEASWSFRDVSVRMLPPRTTTPATRPRADTVDVSAFAPAAGEAGRPVLVQVYLHKPRQQARAAAYALAADPDAARRSVATLATDIESGARVEVRLDAPDLSIDDAIQIVTWRGDPCACQFVATLPADAAGRSFFLTARLLVDGIPVGKLAFSLKGVAASQPAERTMEIQGETALRYRRAFLSYASQDRVEVLNSVKYLRAAGIEVFQDILSLGPGEQWGPRLYQEIDRCDLFLLFWSSHAAQSEWVRAETEYALKRRQETDGRSPDITPFILEGPPVPAPPPSLTAIHFNDPVCYVIAAERQARGL